MYTSSSDKAKCTLWLHQSGRGASHSIVRYCQHQLKGEGEDVVHVTDLREPPGYQSCLEFGNLSLLVCLLVKTPLRTHRFLPLRYPAYYWKGPGFYVAIQLRLHGLSPPLPVDTPFYPSCSFAGGQSEPCSSLCYFGSTPGFSSHSSSHPSRYIVSSCRRSPSSER